MAESSDENIDGTLERVQRMLKGFRYHDCLDEPRDMKIILPAEEVQHAEEPLSSDRVGFEVAPKQAQSGQIFSSEKLAEVARLAQERRSSAQAALNALIGEDEKRRLSVILEKAEAEFVSEALTPVTQDHHPKPIAKEADDDTPREQHQFEVATPSPQMKPQAAKTFNRPITLTKLTSSNEGAFSSASQSAISKVKGKEVSSYSPLSGKEDAFFESKKLDAQSKNTVENVANASNIIKPKVKYLTLTKDGNLEEMPTHSVESKEYEVKQELATPKIAPPSPQKSESAKKQISSRDKLKSLTKESPTKDKREQAECSAKKQQLIDNELFRKQRIENQKAEHAKRLNKTEYEPPSTKKANTNNNSITKAPSKETKPKQQALLTEKPTSNQFKEIQAKIKSRQEEKEKQATKQRNKDQEKIKKRDAEITEVEKRIIALQQNQNIDATSTSQVTMTNGDVETNSILKYAKKARDSRKSAIINLNLISNPPESTSHFKSQRDVIMSSTNMNKVNQNTKSMVALFPPETNKETALSDKSLTPKNLIGMGLSKNQSVISKLSGQGQPMQINLKANQEYMFSPPEPRKAFIKTEIPRTTSPKPVLKPSHPVGNKSGSGYTEKLQKKIEYHQKEKQIENLSPTKSKSKSPPTAPQVRTLNSPKAAAQVPSKPSPSKQQTSKTKSPDLQRQSSIGSKQRQNPRQALENHVEEKRKILFAPFEVPDRPEKSPGKHITNSPESKRREMHFTNIQESPILFPAAQERGGRQFVYTTGTGGNNKADYPSSESLLFEESQIMRNLEIRAVPLSSDRDKDQVAQAKGNLFEKQDKDKVLFDLASLSSGFTPSVSAGINKEFEGQGLSSKVKILGTEIELYDYGVSNAIDKINAGIDQLIKEMTPPVIPKTINLPKTEKTNKKSPKESDKIPKNKSARNIPEKVQKGKTKQTEIKNHPSKSSRQRGFLSPQPKLKTIDSPPDSVDIVEAVMLRLNKQNQATQISLSKRK
jgi:hypothetical protein